MSEPAFSRLYTVVHMAQLRSLCLIEMGDVSPFLCALKVLIKNWVDATSKIRLNRGWG